MIAPPSTTAIHRATEADLPAVRAVLEQDPVWCAYALADLQPAFQPNCDWYLPRGDGGRAVVLVFRLLEPPVFFAVGPGPVVARILAATSVPPRIYMTVQAEQLAPLETYYDFGEDVRPMWRMGMVDLSKLVGPAMPGLRRLTPDDAPRMHRLYVHGGPFTPDAFQPYQIDNGVFYGVEARDGELAAMGGTHIVDWNIGVAAIGNMYTRPDQRGRGYASAVLRAIGGELQGRGVSNIVLNVDQRNAVAQRLYTTHGFAVHCAYLEGVGQRKKTTSSTDGTEGCR